MVRQSNIVNTLALITAKQESDEPIRRFAACLRSLAAVWNTCTCLLKVSKVVKWVRMFLVCGLNDKDTKQAVLSKVDQMTLDDTIDWQELSEVTEWRRRFTGSKRKKSQEIWKNANIVGGKAKGKVRKLI